MAFDPMELGFIRVLRGLDRSQILAFLDACKAIDVPGNEVIVEEGEEDDAMLFLLEGELEVYVGREPNITSLRFIRRGDALGEMALLGLSSKRTASIRSTEPCDILVLERGGYDKLVAAGHPVVDRLQDQVLRMLAERIRETDARIGQLAEGVDLEDREPEGIFSRLTTAVVGTGPRGRAPAPVDVLSQSAHFRDLPKPIMQLLAQHLEVVGMPQGEQVLVEGSMKGDAWILATGEVGVYRTTRKGLQEKVGTLHPGALFGHLAIIGDDSRTATCITDQASWLYRMPREVVKALVESATVEGRALRHCFIHALGWQLQQANERLAAVTAQFAPRGVQGTDREKLKAAQTAVAGAD